MYRINNWSLKARFIAACLLLVTISTAGYCVAVAHFVELLEDQLRDERLRGELEEFVDAYRADASTHGPRATGLSSFVLAPEADDSGLPAPLRDLKPGVHSELHIDGLEAAAGRADVDGARLYVVLDVSAVEAFETRFVVIAVFCALASWAGAVLLALWLARRVLQPVARLADLVAAAQPGDVLAPLAPQFGEREIGMIAAAFDRFIERMEAFVTREQAFTEDASHELRTPLAVIDSSVQLLLDDAELGSSARTRVQRIARAVQQMQMLIESLLFLSRERGIYADEDLPLQQLVGELVDTHRELLGGKALTISIDSVPVTVRAPRGMASCVVSNLLLNAIHYTEHGTIRLTLTPAHLIIQDTGIGIPPQDLERIFERRFRGAQSRGLGLGLYLVKRICDRLGWQVRLASTPDVGTRFEIRFGG